VDGVDIIVNNLYKSFEGKELFDDFNIVFKENEVNTIVGKSGCGKTTLLKMIVGMRSIDYGEILGVDPNSISYIFQEDRLIDWLTIRQNIEFVISKDYSKEERNGVVDKYLELVGIYEYRDSFPQTLSGGIRQRVNIARALAKPSKLIIMDEPFKSIDIKNKLEIMEYFEKIITDEKRTVLFVTHDIEEAVYFDGYIYVFGDKPVRVKKTYDMRELVDYEEHQEIKKNVIDSI
jgi:NitT/TauT family transport system ATP-binding protein